MAVDKLNITLLREKFILFDAKKDPEQKAGVVAMSNRIYLQLVSKTGKETYAVRTQNMHTCVRLATRILNAFIQGGALENRPTPFDWEKAWENINNEFEKKFNEDLWCALYQRGKVIFKSGEPHPFLDLIEKCDYENKGPYDASIPAAERAFQATGKDIKIDYDGNVALTVDLTPKRSRCGVILRGPDKTTTFNFNIVPEAKSDVIHFPQILSAAAAFLEGIQLSFMVGMTEAKKDLGLVERFSTDDKKMEAGRRRAGMLNSEIKQMEDSYKVSFRPERPDFRQIEEDAIIWAEGVFTPQQDEAEEEGNVTEDADNIPDSEATA